MKIIWKKFHQRRNFSEEGLIRIELNEDTKSVREKLVWTETNVSRGQDIKQIVEQREKYWPLTARAIFYRVLQSCLHQPHWHKNGKVENGPLKPSTLTDTVGEILKWFRIEDVIPWGAIEDDLDQEPEVEEKLRQIRGKVRDLIRHELD